MLAIEYIYGVKRKLLKILFVVALLSVGWVIGYLNVPFIDPSKHFWVGFIACFVLMVLGMLVSQARLMTHLISCNLLGINVFINKSKE